MLARIASFAVRNRRRVLACAVLFILFSAAVASGAITALSPNGGFGDPKADAVKSQTVSTELQVGSPGLVFLVRPHGGNVQSGAGQRQGIAITQAVTQRVLQAGGAVTDVQSYWNVGLSQLRSKDLTIGLVLVRLTELPDPALAEAKTVMAGMQDVAKKDDVTLGIGGPGAIYQELGDTVKGDLQRADRVAIPITLMFLVLIFGSVVAACLPLAIGLLSIVGALMALRLLVFFTPVSIFGADLAAALGLGLGIDYGLFILTRFREEMAAGADRPTAAVTAVRTAGRTVLFSALTVAGSLAALLVFKLYYLRSFGYAGVAATVIAAFCAVVVLPALLVALGPKLDKGDLRKPLRRVLRLPPPPPSGLTPPGGGAWHKIAIAVMKRPIVLGGSVIVLLVLAGLPFYGVRFGLPDDNALPPNSPSHLAMNLIRSDFGKGTIDAVTITSTDSQVAPGPMAAYEKKLSELRDVDSVDGPAGTYVRGALTSAPDLVSQAIYEPWGGSWISITPSVDGFSKRGTALVREVRAMPSPMKGALVGGSGAQLIDLQHSVGHSLPIALGIITVVTLLVLFLFTGSVVIPLKAIVMTLLSLTSSFGIMVWGFQDGHLAHLLNFNVTGTIDTTIPILMFCVVFGLSMDYEVFLLSRIKEEYDRTGDNVAAVAMGLERTGRVVSAAAVLLAIVFLAFASSQVVFIKLLGVGASCAVIVDATLVRGVLVPSFMRLMGRANWWAPGPLKRFWEKFGLREEPDAPVVAVAVSTPTVVLPDARVIDLREPEREFAPSR